MRASSLIAGLSVLGFSVLVFVHITLHVSHHNEHHPAGPAEVASAKPHQEQVDRLLELIRAQNATITSLTGLVESPKKGPPLSNSLLREKDAQIRELKAALSKSLAASQTVVAQSSSSGGGGTDLKTIDGQCEQLYGMSLVENWKRNAQTWCESGEEEGLPGGSKLVCYPYHQHHKIKDGRGPDVFCHATNIFVDFSKVGGSHAPHGKPPLSQQYLSFAHGSLSSPCKKTPFYRPNLFMPHHALQMSSFQPDTPAPPLASVTVEETSTYLLARDEDCENSFHSTADFMNMFLVLQALGVSPSNLQVMLFDRHSDGPYLELLEKAFAGGRKPIRKEKYAGRKVLFRSLVFHLESPAGLIFPKVYNLHDAPEPLRCRNTGLFAAYSRFVLEAFGLWDVPPPPIPQVTLSLRHRTQTKNVGRVLANEEEIVAVLREGNMMNFEVVDTAQLPYSKQLEIIRRTNVLVGVHGAGLMLIMFAANEAVLVELHPSYRQDRHFRHAARMSGRLYMPLRSSNRETCHGSSDNVLVPVDEFRKTMDGALRLARNFDDGISECGLRCPTAFLALDSRLAPHYKPGEERGPKANTDFPCG